jgi:hypothetical protein
MKTSVLRMLGIAGVLGVAALVAHSRPTPVQATGVIDSVIPRGVALERFRQGLPKVDSLSGGARSRDALVRDYIRALETRDTTALAALVMTRPEYAWLYYPTNPQALPPYDLSPSLLWFMIEQRSQQGLGHALGERGGQPLHVVGYGCDARPSEEGENRVWAPCMVRRLQAPGDTVTERLFGPILERGGRFKFVSLANKL